MESIYLMGSEDVRSAANTMRSAAEEMNRAASYFQSVVEQQQRFMDDWLDRLQTAMEPKP